MGYVNSTVMSAFPINNIEELFRISKLLKNNIERAVIKRFPDSGWQKNKMKSLIFIVICPHFPFKWDETAGITDPKNALKPRSWMLILRPISKRNALPVTFEIIYPLWSFVNRLLPSRVLSYIHRRLLQSKQDSLMTKRTTDF